jgi:hypothetical protein
MAEGGTEGEEGRRKGSENAMAPSEPNSDICPDLAILTMKKVEFEGVQEKLLGQTQENGCQQEDEFKQLKRQMRVKGLVVHLRKGSGQGEDAAAAATWNLLLDTQPRAIVMLGHAALPSSGDSLGKGVTGEKNPPVAISHRARRAYSGLKKEGGEREGVDAMVNGGTDIQELVELVKKELPDARDAVFVSSPTVHEEGAEFLDRFKQNARDDFFIDMEAYGFMFHVNTWRSRQKRDSNFLETELLGVVKGAADAGTKESRSTKEKQKCAVREATEALLKLVEKLTTQKGWQSCQNGNALKLSQNKKSVWEEQSKSGKYRVRQDLKNQAQCSDEPQVPTTSLSPKSWSSWRMNAQQPSVNAKHYKAALQEFFSKEVCEQVSNDAKRRALEEKQSTGYKDLQPHEKRANQSFSPSENAAVKILKDPPGENGRETSEVQEHDAEEDYEDGEERENHDPVDNPSSLDEEDRTKKRKRKDEENGSVAGPLLPHEPNLL